jgi:iron(III) transport system substrate-binding protein
VVKFLHNTIGRRGLLGGAAALGAGLSMPARSQAQVGVGITDALIKAAKAEGALTYYHTSDLGLTAKWTAAFTRKYGVSVKNIRGPSYPLFDRWMNEERVGRHIADVVQISDPTVFAPAKKEGFIADFRPAAGAAIPDALKVEGVWYALNVDFMGIIYNTKETTADEVKALTTGGWDALTDPRWNGRYATTTPAAGGSTYTYWYMFMTEYKDRYGEAFVRKLAAHKPTIYSSKVLAFDRLAAGEFAVSDMAVQSTMTELYAKGAPIRWFFPDPTPGNPLVQIVSAKAPKPNGARLFQEWALGPDGQAEWLNYTSIYPSLPGVIDPRKAAHKDWFGEPWYAEPKNVYLSYLKEPGFADPAKPLIPIWNKIFNYQTDSAQ